jgi:hypothetical protein
MKAKIHFSMVKPEPKSVCNFLSKETTPDAVWHLNHPSGDNLYVSYEAALDALPKIIIDAFVNKHNRIPTAEDLTQILSDVLTSMNRAIKVSKLENEVTFS